MDAFLLIYFIWIAVISLLIKQIYLVLEKKQGLQTQMMIEAYHEVNDNRNL